MEDPSLLQEHVVVVEVKPPSDLDLEEQKLEQEMKELHIGGIEQNDDTKDESVQVQIKQE